MGKRKLAKRTKVAFVKDCTTPDRVRNGVKTAFEIIGGLESLISPGRTVLIKPNFVAPLKKAVTSFDVIAAVVEEVKRCGGVPVIAESSGFEFDTKETFKILGVPELAKSLEVPLVNLDEQAFREVPLPGHPLVKTVLLPEILFKSDVFINLPKLKRHKVTEFTFGLKNLFGLPHRTSRRQMHAFGLTQGILSLNRIIRSDITLVDGTETVSSAAYGEAQTLGYIIAGRDVAAVDRFCCELLGSNFLQIDHIQKARHGQLGQNQFEIVGDKRPQATKASKQTRPLRDRIYKGFFQLMHLADIVFSKLFGGKSIIPWVNYYLGVRPVLIPERSGECGECAKLCPVNAIDLEGKRIIAERCMTVRCMRCVEGCPHGAFTIKMRSFLSN